MLRDFHIASLEFKVNGREIQIRVHDNGKVWISGASEVCAAYPYSVEKDGTVQIHRERVFDVKQVFSVTSGLDLQGELVAGIRDTGNFFFGPHFPTLKVLGPLEQKKNLEVVAHAGQGGEEKYCVLVSKPTPPASD